MIIGNWLLLQQKNWIVLLFSLLVSFFSKAQTDKIGDSLLLVAKNATTPQGKIDGWGGLADYHIATNDSLSRYYQQRSVEEAELSRDRKLIIRNWLRIAARYLNISNRLENISKAREAANRALNIARTEKMDEQVAFCQLMLARTWRVEGDAAKALELINNANAIAASSQNDSLKVRTYNALGDAYLLQNNNLLAFRNYLNGLEVAENTNRYKELTYSYGRMMEFYLVIKQYEKAKDYAYKILELDSLNKEWILVLDDYLNIGRVYSSQKDFDMALHFYEKAIAEAGKRGFERYKVKCYASITNMYFSADRFKEGLEYMQRNPSLAAFIEKAGMGYSVDFARGSVYIQLGQLDSAYYYLKKSQPFYEQYVTYINRYSFYMVYARYLQQRKDYSGSLTYLDKAKAIGETSKNLELLQYVYQQMDTVSGLAGKYADAWQFRGQAQHLTDSLESLSKEKDLVAVEIDKENRQKEKKTQEAAERIRKRHNVQYLGITAAIGTIFILLVAAGLFSVSRNTVRIIGFFAFIFLFEFIILLADNQIHHWTHGEPWKVMAIKILLIALLLPLHHYLEHKVIHYLNQKNLLLQKKKKNPSGDLEQPV